MDEMIQRHLDGELNEVETTVFEQHMDSCKLCSQQLREYTLMMKEIENLDVDVEIEDEISDIRHTSLNELFDDGGDRIGIKEIVVLNGNSIKNTFMFIKFIPGRNKLKKGAEAVSKATMETSKVCLKLGLKTLRARLVQ